MSIRANQRFDVETIFSSFLALHSVNKFNSIILIRAIFCVPFLIVLFFCLIFLFVAASILICICTFLNGTGTTKWMKNNWTCIQSIYAMFDFMSSQKSARKLFCNQMKIQNEWHKQQQRRHVLKHPLMILSFLFKLITWYVITAFIHSTLCTLCLRLRSHFLFNFSHLFAVYEMMWHTHFSFRTQNVLKMTNLIGSVSFETKISTEWTKKPS